MGFKPKDLYTFWVPVAVAKLPNFKTGDLIHQSDTIHTGLNGKFVGLLSNGTLLTLDKATRMKVSKFEQEAFADDGAISWGTAD